MNKKVEKFYYENYREYPNGKTQALNIYQNNNGKLEGGRQHDPIYNDENVGRQIYTFGDSWTYGWDIEQDSNLYSFTRR